MERRIALPPSAARLYKALERLRSRYCDMQADPHLPGHMRDFSGQNYRSTKDMIRDVNLLAKWLREQIEAIPNGVPQTEEAGEESPYREGER